MGWISTSLFSAFKVESHCKLFSSYHLQVYQGCNIDISASKPFFQNAESEVVHLFSHGFVKAVPKLSVG